ncbi:MAG: hypothetical protein EWV52_14065 [Microcystis panniformis Mp_MB_F_20051200_S6D]|nr:MAG: hypothetical protein EWV86_08235 [Microcystis panniformis Mp_MB_F_20051200_S9D]TRV71199.1 MAG: hypothetical protein EWV52_14065 [Microcystis panniformis Mp_MB_F_20051200_S6D]
MPNKARLEVNVIDAIMGSGKTTLVINMINQSDKSRFIYITPTLNEVERIKEKCIQADFKEPDTNQHGSKYYSFKKLIENGENIVTTHALFKLLTKEILADIKRKKYTLVIDEALDCVEIYGGITKADLEILFRDSMINVEQGTFRLKWNEATHGNYSGKFDQIRKLCSNGNLVYFKGTTLLWEFPVESLNVFNEIYILTYLFQGSAMANYLKAYDAKINMFSVKGFSCNGDEPTLIPYKELDEKVIKDIIRPIISIYEGSSNDIGVSNGRNNPLSSSWYKRAKPLDIDSIKKALHNFFNGFARSKSIENAWTTFKDYKSKLAGKGYAKGFLPNNLRATNDYIEKKAIAYTCNTFYHPIVKNYFEERGVTIYEDVYALSEMLQFIWRFQIRRHDPIILFIPSERMRHLLKVWLRTTNGEQLFEELGYKLP